MRRRYEAGFSLVEIAIGLIIIGLIAGGILKGQELIVQARLQKTLTQIVSYQVAYNAFKERYWLFLVIFCGTNTLESRDR